VIPLAIKYNLSINSKFDEADSAGLTTDIKNKQGTVLIVWQHKLIPSIARGLLGNDFHLSWKDDDFDSIWIITFTNGVATLTEDKEGFVPAPDCPD
jgi:hypothetical protein